MSDNIGVVLGIDVGGSTTKITGFLPDGTLLPPIFVRATDPLTSLYGALGKFTDVNDISLDDISRIMVTGVGSTYITKPLYGMQCTNVPEFRCIGLGGLYISGLERAIVVSMGTGTAMTYTIKGEEPTYLGGTGVGGGTLSGLSKLLLGMDNISHVAELAKEGSLSKVDLTIRDITSRDRMSGLPEHMTAANFGKVSDLAGKPDIALGIINMVFETVGMFAVFAARNHELKDIVLTGNLTTVPQAAAIFANMGKMFGMNFILPENSRYGTVIGAALAGIVG